MAGSAGVLHGSNTVSTDQGANFAFESGSGSQRYNPENFLWGT
jgi:hypothetical protein